MRWEQEFRMAFKRDSFVGLGRRQRISIRVCWTGSFRHMVGDEGANITKGRWDIRVEAGKCPETAYFVP
jgi:hypothetical protein